MSQRATHPTPYPDVNAVLCELLAGVREVLGDQFVGLYLHGSLAHGAFGDGSDIDFCVATAGELPEEMHADLAAMHQRIASSGLEWATKLEGGYVPKRSLRRADPANAHYPCFDVRTGLYLEPDNGNWVLARHVLREQGVVVAGPSPRDLIDALGPDDLRQAARDILRDWWAPILDDPTRMSHPEYPRYAVLTMCRIFYTLERGTVVSKPVAARWAQGTLDQRWEPLIDRYSRVQSGAESNRLDEVLEFVRYTVERSLRGGAGDFAGRR
jgi:hypothetical protein